MGNIKITKKHLNSVNSATKPVLAADDEFDDFEMDEFDEDDGLMDAVDDVADAVEDVQDTIDDVQEDTVDIEMNNNISNHFIAECDKCYGVFISAVIESDQKIDHVSGVCPLCNKESDQYLKWIIKENK